MGLIVTVTGRSGVGKSRRVSLLVGQVRGTKRIVSYTTRLPREGDAHGEYAHVSAEIFERMSACGTFLWAPSHNRVRYGTARVDLAHAVKARGMRVLTVVPQVIAILRTELDAQGALDQHIPLYILNPGDDVLRQRLAKRAGFDEATIRARMEAECRWDEEAAACSIPYRFISNTPDKSQIWPELKDILGL